MLKLSRTTRWVTALVALVSSAAASAQPPVTQDYGFIPVNGVPTTRSFSIGLPTTVLWAKITIQRIDAAEGAYLDIHTGTDPVAPILNDTEIGLYNSSGTLIASDDDSGTGSAGRSLLSFGSTTPRAALPSGGIPAGVNGPTLPSGVYYVAVAGYNKIFGSNYSVTSGTPNTQIGNIALTVVADRFAITTPPPAQDLGLVVTNRLPIAAGPFAVAGPTFYWTKFNLETGTSAASNYVDLHTNGSSITNDGSGVNDTEIAVYNSSGAIVAQSDDYGSVDANSNLLSGLSFGRTSGPRTYGNLLNFAGQDGQLNAGTYYVAVGAYNLQPSSTGFRVQQTNSSTIGAGLVRLNIETNIGKAIDYDLGTVVQINSPASSPVFTQGAGEVRWVKFRSTVATDAANVFLDIHTFGSSLLGNDTEIGLYTANGTLFRQNDDWTGSARNESGLSFGRTTGPRIYGDMGPFSGQSGAVLIPGEYYIAITTFDSTFADGFVVGAGPRVGTVMVTVNTNAGPGLTYNFGEVSKRNGTYSSPSLNTLSATTVWVKFTTAAATNNAGRFLDINTNGSALNDPSRPTALDDTEIGLFDARGNLIDSSDDWNSQDNTAGAGLSNDYRSGLSFGNTVASRQYVPMRNFNGQDGAALPAGTYFVALNGFNTDYTSPFVSTPSATTSRGAIKLNIITNLPATPCSVADVAGLGGSPGADGQLTADDVIVFIGAYLMGDVARADIAGLGGTPGADGQLTADDLILFLQRYFVGCI